MADTKISQLPAATTPLSGAEVVPLVQSGATVQTPVNEINKLITETPSTFSAVQTFTASPIISVTDNTNAALRVTQLGTGNALLIEDSTNPDSSPFVVTAGGDVGMGRSSPSSFGANWTTVEIAGRDTSSGGALRLANSDASAQGDFYIDNSNVVLRSVTSIPLVLGTVATARLRIDTSGNILNISSGGLGYGTGSGGTVTQITSKSTGVTLNKTNGQIVTHNANLGTANPVGFVVTNSTVAATDTVIIHRSSGGTNAAYVVGCDVVSAGSFRVYISNISGGALAEALTLNFAVIKAVTS